MSKASCNRYSELFYADLHKVGVCGDQRTTFRSQFSVFTVGCEDQALVVRTDGWQVLTVLH